MNSSDKEPVDGSSTGDCKNHSGRAMAIKLDLNVLYEYRADFIGNYPENLSELDLERVKELLAVEVIRKELS